MCQDLVQRIVPAIVMVMKDSNMTVADIDEIALVGDFTRTPMIERMIAEMFKNKAIRQHDMTSHYLASHGASLESAVVQGISGKEHKDLLQLDATSRGLGVETFEGQMSIVIPRNTVFPCQRKYIFTTTQDNQTEFPIKMFEGDSQIVFDNDYLGSFTLESLPAG